MRTEIPLTFRAVDIVVVADIDDDDVYNEPEVLVNGVDIYPLFDSNRMNASEILECIFQEADKKRSAK